MLGYSVSQFKPIEHYILMSRWYEQRKFPIVPLEFLPKTGLVVSHDGVFICMGHLYFTDGGIASIAHLVSSPVATSDERHTGLDLLLLKLITIAKEQKFKMVTIATNLEKLFDRIDKLGFKKTDENVTHFGRLLWLGD